LEKPPGAATRGTVGAVGPGIGILVRAVLPAFVFVGLLLTLLLPRRAEPRARTELKLIASNLWTLDHLCLAMSSVLREWPELQEIRVDMRDLLVVDEASISSMKHALQTTRASQVRLLFDGYDARMAASLLGGGIAAAHLGAPRRTPLATSETLH
jgi:hypothetical protein